MQLFRTSPQAGLKKAEAALIAAQAKIEELQAARHLALLEADTVESVAAIDSEIAKERAAANVHRDRIAALKAAVRTQQGEETERLRQAALIEVQKRLDAQIELAREVEAAVKHLGDRWGKLLQWRQAIVSAWPPGLPLPPADAFVDQRGLMRELAVALHAAGKPRWDKQTSIPNPAASIPVQGLEPRGLSAFVREAGAAFISRLKSTSVHMNDDEEAA